MRLIDADALKEHIKKYTSVFTRYDWREICEMLNDAPTVDAVEVVRCRDCKHYWKNKPRKDVPVCLASPKDDAFCSEGERREDE